MLLNDIESAGLTGFQTSVICGSLKSVNDLHLVFDYLFDSWNQLDLLIIVLSLLGIVLEEVQTDVIPINPTIMRVMRILRIARGGLFSYSI